MVLIKDLREQAMPMRFESEDTLPLPALIHRQSQYRQYPPTPLLQQYSSIHALPSIASSVRRSRSVSTYDRRRQRRQPSVIRKRKSSSDIDLEINEQKSDNDASPVNEERTQRGFRWVLIFAAVYSTMFLFALDNTIVANIQPSILRDLGNVQSLTWISAAFPLAASATNLLWGRIFSEFDCKWAFINSVIIFEVGSALCGAAQTMNMLIAGRVIAGLGAQGIYLGAMTIVGVLSTPAERSLYIAISGIVWGLGTMLGPAIGGGFSQSGASWRWSFYINLCIAVVFAPVYLFILPPMKLFDGGDVKTRLKKIDYIGTVLLAAVVCLINTGVTLGGVEAPWSSAKVIATLAAGVVALGLFLAQQRWTIGTNRMNQIFPSSVKMTTELAILCLQSACGGGLAIVPIYFLPLYFQLTRGVSPIKTALEILPLVIFMVFCSMLSGGFATKRRHYGLWFLVAGMCGVAGAVMMYRVKIETSNAFIYGAQVLLGIGSGLVMQLPYSIIQLKTDPHAVALVNGIISQVQIGGFALMLTIANTIFLNLSFTDLAAALPEFDPGQIQSLVVGTTGDALGSLTADQRNLVLETIVEAISKSYIFVIGLACVDLVTALLLMKETVDPAAAMFAKDEDTESKD